MKPMLLLFAVIGFVAAILLFRMRAESGPPPAVFSPMSLAQAREAVAVRGREDSSALLLVKATASWCPPCKEMDRTTFRDARVERWFATNGLVIALDIDRAPADADRLGVRAVPTLIVFDREGRELDRGTGAMDADGLLGWLDSLRRARTSAPETQSVPINPG